MKGISKTSLITFFAMLIGANYCLADSAEDARIEHGRYIAQTAGCNDCHTAGYAIKDGDVPVSQWLLGDSFGWRGPWGTTYGSNLRLFVSGMSEQDWIKAARSLRRRPPMPWFNLNAMSDRDLGDLYVFIRSLGEPGQAATSPLPPDQQPSTPYAQWVLQ